METKLIEVVAGIIVRRSDAGTRILLTQRRYDDRFPYTWCTPGGKVDPGETHREALARELREEVGVGVRFIHDPYIWDTILPDVGVRVSVYLVQPDDTDPYARERQGIGWFTAGDLKHLTLAPADALCRDKMIYWLSKSVNE